jgi:hypothetical protein
MPAAARRHSRDEASEPGRPRRARPPTRPSPCRPRARSNADHGAVGVGRPLVTVRARARALHPDRAVRRDLDPAPGRATRAPRAEGRLAGRLPSQQFPTSTGAPVMNQTGKAQWHSTARCGPTSECRAACTTLPARRSAPKAEATSATGDRSAWARLCVDIGSRPHVARHRAIRFKIRVDTRRTYRSASDSATASTPALGLPLRARPLRRAALGWAGDERTRTGDTVDR